MKFDNLNFEIYFWKSDLWGKVYALPPHLIKDGINWADEYKSAFLQCNSEWKTLKKSISLTILIYIKRLFIKTEFRHLNY